MSHFYMSASMEEGEDIPNTNLVDMPTDILLAIFSLCGPDSWPALAQVCERFHIILGPNSWLWEQISRRLLFVNETSQTLRSRYVEFDSFLALPKSNREWCDHQDEHLWKDFIILTGSSFFLIEQKKGKIWNSFL